MKKILLLIAAAGLVAGSASAAQRAASPAKQAIAKANKAAKAIRKINDQHSEAQWRPGTIANYALEDGEWVGPFNQKCTYTPEGRIASLEVENQSKVLYTYNEDGMIATEVQSYYNEWDEKWVESSNITYTYDSVVKDFVVKQETKAEWGTYVNGYKIERNAEGNVTSITEYSSSDDYYYEYATVRYYYGTDGKVNKMTTEDEDGVYHWVDNITWENTDGQILEFEYDEYEANLYFGANRIKSGDIMDDDWPSLGKLTVEYKGKDYKSKILVDDTTVLDIDYKWVDDFGSYDVKMSDTDIDEDEGEYYVDYTDISTISFRVDAYGIVLLEKTESECIYSNESYEPSYEVEGYHREVTYDEEFGYPLEVLEYEIEEDEEELCGKTVYSDYAEYEPTTAIEDVTVENAPVEYFTIQGIRVENPGKGLYIRRQGATTTKVIF